MSTDAHCTPEPRAVPAFPPHLVSLFVADTHPLLQLKRALDWPALQAVLAPDGGQVTRLLCTVSSDTI